MSLARSAWKRRSALLPAVAYAAACVAALAACSPSGTPGPALPTDPPAAPALHGRIVDESGGAVEGAVVRWQATEVETTSDIDGRFTLPIPWEGIEAAVSAWADGYYCARLDSVGSEAGEIVIILRRYQTGDNPDYEWVPPVGEGSCYSCKPGVTQVWLENDAHAGSAVSPRFLSMYNGTDLAGNQSPLTRTAYLRDYGAIPLRPDPSRPYYGPGYKLDFPNSAGNCAACHTPGPAIDTPYGIDPNTVSGADSYGVHCDFCHKIADVRLDPSSGLPRPNTPGVLSMDFRRPFPEDPERFQLFFGTFDDDNVPEEDTYLPLLEESAFCAPCHFGIFWDTVVYNSYGEWLESRYSDPSFEGAKTCQACHMPVPTMFDGRAITNVAPEAGGVERDPLSIHAHTFPGAADEALLQNAVTMQVEADRAGGSVRVRVTLTNDLTGHHVPTDSPLRHLILLVQARDGDGRALVQIEGPVLPEWIGVGDPVAGYYAGLPGTAYARVLQELWTEVAPSGAYWMPTRVLSDNRLAAFASESSTYGFEAPEGEIDVEVVLLFRRAYIELMDLKGWGVADTVMEEARLRVP